MSFELIFPHTLLSLKTFLSWLELLSMLCLFLLNQLSSWHTLLGLRCEASKLRLRCQLPQLYMGKVLCPFTFNSLHLSARFDFQYFFQDTKVKWKSAP